MVRCLKSILGAGILLEQYADKLKDEGWRPDRRTRDEDPPADAEHARLDDDDNNEDKRVNVASFHQWGRHYWDLPISPINDDLDAMSEDIRLELDSLGRVTVWRGLEAGTNNKNRCKLLSERIGLTPQMLGIDTIMLDALIPYKILV